MKWCGFISILVFWVGQLGASEQPLTPPEPVNYILGTQTIGIRYTFTEDTGLVETAKRIHEMGSNLLKIALNQKYCGADYSLPERDDIQSLVDLATKEPSFKTVLDMPFATYHLWAYSFTSGWWDDGLSKEESANEYREIYDLARYLRTEYDGTGKTFLLGHWEGDWHLHKNYDGRKPLPDTAFQGMVDWLNIRQKAVDDAKRDTPGSNVNIFHYTEVCLVDKAMKGGKCLVNDVLPKTQVDYVSYSAYDVLGWGGKKSVPTPPKLGIRLQSALDYIESRLHPKPDIKGKRVFIGEFGFAGNRVGAQVQNDLSIAAAKAAIEWGCPYVLYWEMYCNEKKDAGYEGFWLIDDQDQKQPFYHTLKHYYGAMEENARKFKHTQGRSMTDGEFRKEALDVLEGIAAGAEE